MLKTIKLYGELADRCGKVWTLDINSPAEAIKALCVNNEGLKQFLLHSQDRGVGYQVVVGKSYIQNSKEIAIPSGRSEIKIIPVVLGSKSKLGKILVGAVMIYLAYQYGYTEGVGFTFLGQVAMNIGVSLVMSGVAELLAPKPKPPRDADNKVGHNFSGPTNTVKQGIAIPVCYGQLIIGGAVISSGIAVEDTDGT
ncbi:MAG: tail assembly protein [Candidatus Marinimicrobia bacterium]|jgi:predicted phage tail protein|nr:tail assembly protein [Candidatus Neomarinimicrobiota bacterium]